MPPKCIYGFIVVRCIGLNNVNRLAFEMETKHVFCKAEPKIAIFYLGSRTTSYDASSKISAYSKFILAPNKIPYFRSSSHLIHERGTLRISLSLSLSVCLSMYLRLFGFPYRSVAANIAIIGATF